MFKYIFLLLICLSINCSVSLDKKDFSSNDYLEEKVVEESAFFSMRRTACFGQCPTYQISFFKDGKVIYEGKKFVKNEGVYSGYLDVKTIALIESKIREIDFFNLDSIYDARISDLPSVILEVNMDGKNHKVIDRYKGPEKLRSFEKYIDNIILKIENGLLGKDWGKIKK